MGKNEYSEKAVDILQSMLDTGNFDEKLFYRVLDSFKEIPIVSIKPNPENRIIRSSTSSETESIFLGKVARLSYPPKEYAGLARANRKGQPMFYGSVFLKFDEEEKLYSIPPHIISAMETSHIFKDYERKGKVFITHSTWKASRQLNLLLLPSSRMWMYPSVEMKLLMDFTQNNVVLRQLYSAEEYRFGFFLGDLMARPAYSCLYEITSRVTDYLLSKPGYADVYDGIAYPSTKSEGNGFNVCLKPSVVDECLGFESASVAMIERDEKHANEYHVADAVRQSDDSLKWKVSGSGISCIANELGLQDLADPSIINIEVENY